MPTYAQSTSVSVERSRGEIEATLRRFDADGFRYGWSDRDGRRIEQIDFQAQDRVVRFTLVMPSKDDAEFAWTPARGYRRSDAKRIEAWEQACRQRWRALALAIKAKLECVESEISSFESEFLAHIVDPETGRTVGETVRPQIAQRYEGLSGPIGLPGLPAPDDALQETA